MKVVIDDYRLEIMDVYTDPLNDKIKRQAAEITRLLAENAELKEKLHEEHHELVLQDGYSQGVSNEAEKWNENVKIIRDNAFEAGQVKGQNDAWALFKKLKDMDFFELVDIFGNNSPWSVVTKYTYPEAAAKVAEWERAKEEIHVGDIVRIHEGNDNDLCIICSSSDGYYNAVDEYGAVYPTLYKKMISKTGRHIDVDAWLAQIGGDCNE